MPKPKTHKSVLTFEDKHTIPNELASKDELDNETIFCEIPELRIDERLVLNAYGSFEVGKCEEYRRRLGIYRVVDRKESIVYTLREEERFSEGELAHLLLSGNSNQIAKETEGLKYFALDLHGNPAYSKSA